MPGEYAWEFGSGQLAPYCAVLVEGVRLGPDAMQRLRMVRVEHLKGKAMIATLTFADESQELDMLDAEVFATGMTWAVVLGWSERPRTFGPFRVASVNEQFTPEGTLLITVELHDQSRKLNRTARFGSFENMTLGDVVQKIAERHGLGYAIEGAESVTFTEDMALMQPGVSDLSLLASTADRFGYHFALEDGSIIFRQREANDDIEPRTLAWRIGDRSLRSFTPEQRTLPRRKNAASATDAQADAKQKGGNVDIPNGDGLSWRIDADGNVVVKNEIQEEKEGGKPTEATNQPGRGDYSVHEPSGSEGRTTGLLEARLAPKGEADSEAPVANLLNMLGDLFGSDQEKEKNAGKNRAQGKANVVKAQAALTVADTTWRIGDPVEVVGVGLRYSGRWICRGFSHVLDRSGLATELHLGKRGLGASSGTADAEAKTGTDGSRDGSPLVEPEFRLDGDGNVRVKLKERKE